MKFVAFIILLFLLYCWINVFAKSRYYNSIELTIWGVVIGLGGWWCIATLLH